VYVNRRTSWSLSGLDPRSGAKRALLERRFFATGPDFSPDGSRLAYFAPEGRGFQVFLAAADGSDPREVAIDSKSSFILPHFSGDGRSLDAYRLRPPSYVHVTLSGITPTNVETLATNFPNYRYLGTNADAEERRLVVPVYEEGSCRRTVVRDLRSGSERPLAEPLLWPRFSPEGDAIAGGALDRALKLCPPTGEACRVLSPRGQEPHWSRGFVYFVRYSDAYGDPDLRTIEVRRVKPDGTAEEHVADLTGFSPVHFFYTVSPTTGEIVWCEYRPSPSEIWTAALPKRPR